MGVCSNTSACLFKHKRVALRETGEIPRYLEVPGVLESKSTWARTTLQKNVVEGTQFLNFYRRYEWRITPGKTV